MESVQPLVGLVHPHCVLVIEDGGTTWDCDRDNTKGSLVPDPEDGTAGGEVLKEHDVVMNC